MLNVEQLTVSLGGGIVLNEVNLQVPDGAVVSMLGRNGMGKTTLLKSIIGLLRPAKGKIILKGEDITCYPPERRAESGIGYIPQGREIFPHLTVYENLVVGLTEQKNSCLEEVLDLFPMLKGLLSRLGGNLSGGEQQQLAIARALVKNPKILLLDEPTEGIQPSVVMEIERIIKRINKEKNVCFLLVEQYLDFALEVTGYFHVLEKGQVVLQGATGEVAPEKIKEYLLV